MATRTLALIMGIVVVGLMVLVVGQGTGQKIGADATPMATDAAVVYIPLIRQQATPDPDAWQHTPTPAGKPLIATSMLGPADVWGVDGQTVWRWDGHAWHAQIEIPGAHLIAMNNDASGWVVTRMSRPGIGAICYMDVWQLQGSAWAPIASPPIPVCVLARIESHSALDITLHGWDGRFDGRYEWGVETRERWDGHTWIIIDPPP